ncbi:hypothetical protein B0J12DRAFT_403701 [Macrophomina phaseolina]|uniref:Uncharacterized protein n=1 Tax=Macrophomina phaseolina TaxID=35725 RepID=A0ABQ8GIK1_9PEZI|nr:hypothetical protein B0J12DRAFT_403701 [Macrophomina phaseolina]
MSCQGPFTDVKVHTAKCSVCDRRNRNTLHKCVECGEQFCRNCFASLPPSKAHGPSDTLELDKPPNSKPDGYGPRASGSGSSSDDLTGSNAPHLHTSASNPTSSTTPRAQAPNSSTQRGVNDAGATISTSTGASASPVRNLPSKSSLAPASSAARPPSSPASHTGASRDLPPTHYGGSSSPDAARASPVHVLLAPADSPAPLRRSSRNRMQFTNFHVLNITEPTLDSGKTASDTSAPESTTADELLVVERPSVTPKRSQFAQLSNARASSPAPVRFHTLRSRSATSAALLDSSRRRLTGKAPGPKALSTTQAKEDLAAIKSPSIKLADIRKRVSSIQLTKPAHRLARTSTQHTTDHTLAMPATRAPLPGSATTVSDSSTSLDAHISIVIPHEDSNSNITVPSSFRPFGRRASADTPASGMSATLISPTTPLFSIATERITDDRVDDGAADLDFAACAIKKERSSITEDKPGSMQQRARAAGEAAGYHSASSPAGAFASPADVKMAEGAAQDDVPTSSSLSTPPSSDFDGGDKFGEGTTDPRPMEEEVDTATRAQSEASYDDETILTYTAPATRGHVSNRLRPRTFLLAPVIRLTRATARPTPQMNHAEPEDIDPRPQTTEWEAVVATLPLSEEFKRKQKVEEDSYEAPFSSLGLLEPSSPVLRRDLHPIGSQRDLPRELRWNDPWHNGGTRVAKAKRSSAMETPQNYSNEEYDFKSRAPPQPPSEPYPASRATYEAFDVSMEALVAPTALVHQRRGDFSTPSVPSSSPSSNIRSRPFSHDAPARNNARRLAENLRSANTPLQEVAPLTPLKRKHVRGGPKSLKPGRQSNVNNSSGCCSTADQHAPVPVPSTNSTRRRAPTDATSPYDIPSKRPKLNPRPGDENLPQQQMSRIDSQQPVQRVVTSSNQPILHKNFVPLTQQPGESGGTRPVASPTMRTRPAPSLPQELTSGRSPEMTTFPGFQRYNSDRSGSGSGAQQQQVYTPDRRTSLRGVRREGLVRRVVVDEEYDVERDGDVEMGEGEGNGEERRD